MNAMKFSDLSTWNSVGENYSNSSSVVLRESSPVKIVLVCKNGCIVIVESVCCTTDSMKTYWSKLLRSKMISQPFSTRTTKIDIKCKIVRQQREKSNERTDFEEGTSAIHCYSTQTTYATKAEAVLDSLQLATSKQGNKIGRASCRERV